MLTALKCRETLSLALKEEYRWRVFENAALKAVFRNSVEATRWGKLRKVELVIHTLHDTLNFSNQGK
jgi:hypothetical protein